MLGLGIELTRSGGITSFRELFYTSDERQFIMSDGLLFKVKADYKNFYTRNQQPFITSDDKQFKVKIKE